MVANNAIDPIGLFDSGVGGLSVLRAIQKELPDESIIYFGDQGHVPYGSRPMQEVQEFSKEITQFLLSKRAKVVVVACNTASAAALHLLRSIYPETMFVGMEPAVKPAVETTHTGVVGVLATPATFQGALYASVVERFGGNVILLQDTCPGLVQQIENGDLFGAETRKILQTALNPMIEKGIDTIVLGCTHYPFVIPLIEQITGPAIHVIDPAPAIARQVKRLLFAHSLIAKNNGRQFIEFFTTSAVGRFRKLTNDLLNIQGDFYKADWVDGHISRIN